MRDRSFSHYAYDDDLIEATRRDGQTRVRVYRLTGTVVVLGSGSRPESELNLEACRADHVPILRRRGGGCAVVIDPGNVLVSVVATGLPFGHHRGHFDALSAWLIDGLARIGIRGVNQAGICDLASGDRKVGGACLHRCRDLLYYSASLLIIPDMDRVARYLQHPPREPDYRGGRLHALFMGSLTELVGAQCAGMSGNGVGGLQVAARLRSALKPPDLSGSDLGGPCEHPAGRSTLRHARPLREFGKRRLASRIPEIQ
jgi:lipoate-protein ligase A